MFMPSARSCSTGIGSGNPYYYAKVYFQRNLYHEVTSDQPTYYDWVEGGGSVKVCGYYVYSTGLHSEEQCVTVR